MRRQTGTPCTMSISVVIPARNEEKNLPLCLDAITTAARHAAIEPEVVVVINRCTDQTEQVARAAGALIVHSTAKNLSAIRNVGAAATTGEILVTIDADSRMSQTMFAEIIKRLDNPKIVGGGVMIWPERFSIGIAASGLMLLPIALWHRISAGLFWCRKSDFDAIGGFDEAWVSVEDIDFAKRLKAYGRKTGRRRFATILRARITTSCRKFDTFGDWFYLKNPRLVWRLFKGRDQASADRMWYDYEP